MGLDIVKGTACPSAEETSAGAITGWRGRVLSHTGREAGAFLHRSLKVCFFIYFCLFIHIVFRLIAFPIPLQVW